MILMLNLPPALKLTDDEFAELARVNQDLRLELTATRKLMIMPKSTASCLTVQRKKALVCD